MNRWAGAVESGKWNDWRWQLQNRLGGRDTVQKFFPGLSDDGKENYRKYVTQFKLGITPYMMSLVELDELGNPTAGDPIWEQFRFFDLSIDENLRGNYNGKDVNWELLEEMPTSILHHKYPDRAILRVTDNCLAYCNYCYLARRTLSLEGHRAEGVGIAWRQTIEYLRGTPSIRDVLVSGGDPLLLSNGRIARILEELRSIDSIKTIRLNTRALTHNPFRFDSELVDILARFRLTALEVHIAHPRELTDVSREALELFDRASHRPLVLWRSPLLRGVNNELAVLAELLLSLYSIRIYPYYLFHFAPFSPGRQVLGTPVKEGVRLMLDLRRNLPGPAIPRYTLFHPSGKQDVPLDPDGTPSFRYTIDEAGFPVVRFLNWRGDWVEYYDVPEYR